MCKKNRENVADLTRSLCVRVHVLPAMRSIAIGHFGFVDAM